LASLDAEKNDQNKAH